MHNFNSYRAAEERPAMTISEEEITMTADDSMPSNLLYEEIRDVPASLTQATIPHSYEEMEAAGLQQTAETMSDSYHFTPCSAYGVSLESK